MSGAWDSHPALSDAIQLNGSSSICVRGFKTSNMSLRLKRKRGRGTQRAFKNGGRFVGEEREEREERKGEREERVRRE